MLKDMTDADLQKINAKLRNLGAGIQLTPEITRAMVQSAVPTGIKIELTPTITNEALAKAVENKVMKIEVSPLLTHLRKALKDATTAAPPEIEVGIQQTKLKNLITRVLNQQGYLINISTVNDNYTKVIQQKLNGKRYTVTIHADAKEIVRSVQASLMQVQSRYFGLQVSRDILRNSIDQALMGKPFSIQIAVMHDQARRAVQNALNNARMVGKDDALAYQRLKTGELKAAQAELARLKAAHGGAADAAKAHASASINLGGAMGSNIKIAGELSSAMASLYSIHAARQFLSQVIEIGGELEHQKIAMDTIFGDKGKTVELFGQIKGLARQSPFGVMELTSSVKRLSAYGVEYNEIYDTAKRLADISAATSVDINRLILAFGKTKSRGFLDGLEAKQFAYANIPIYEMVRKKLEELEGQAVTTADVMARMKKREISFDIVKDVLWDITDEGGKFYNMQEALAGSVKTSWKLVKDNIELMFGEIAESSIGTGLKNIAEILQGLTRNWRTVSAVVWTAAIGLGTYKLATLGVNSAVQKSTIATYNQIIAQKQKNAEELKAWGRISKLTKAELMRIATANKLTNADLRQALAAGTLNDKHVAQLFWQKKITAEQVRYLTSIGLLNPAMSKAILSNNRFTLSLQMMGATLKRVGAALKTFMLNPWTVSMAAISGLVMLYQHMSEQSEKAKELGENLSTKASEGAKNLTEALKGLNGEFSKMSNLKLTEIISKLEQAIKDYGVSADKVMFYSQSDENGKARTLENRAKYLYEQAKILEGAYAQFRDMKVGDMVERALDSTNGSFWSFKWYEGLQTDLDDYVKDVKNAQKDLTTYLRDHEDEAKLVVKFAVENDPEFARLTQGMGTEEAMAKLVSDLDRLKSIYDKIPVTPHRARLIDGVSVGHFVELQKSFLGNIFNTDITHSANEALRETERVIQSLREDLLAKDSSFFDADKWTAEKSKMLGMAYQKIFENLNSLDYQYQMPFVDAWNEAFNTALDPGFLEGQILSKFDSLIPELGDELAKKVRNGVQLEDAEEKKVKSLFEKAVQSVKDGWPGKAAEIQKIVDSNPVYANILLSVNVRNGMDPWKQQVDDAFGNNPDITMKIKAEADTQSTLKALADLKKSTKESLDKFALTFNIKPNFAKLEKLSTEAPLSQFEIQQREEYNKQVDVWNDLTKGSETLNINLDEWGKDKNKHGGSQKDALAESLKQRFKDIKDAYAMFKEWAKLEGKDAAFKRVGNSGLFATLAPDKVPQTVDEYLALIDELEKDLKAAGIKGHNQRETLANDLIKERFGINKDTFKEQLQLALDKVSKEAERQLENWNLYDKVRKATGNQDLAMNIAFGMNGDGQTDYVRLMKDRFDAIAKEYGSAFTYDTATPELLQKEGIQEVQKAYEQTYGDISKYHQKESEEVVDILAKYQSLQDKLVKIDYDRNEEIRKINESKGLTPEQKAQTIQRINVEADYQKFTQSADYLKFFSGIYSLTMDQAQQIGDKIRLHLDQRLQAGKISAEDYYKEIERINQQLNKLRNVKSDAMTFLTGGVKGLNQKNLEKADSDVLAQMTKVQKAEEALAKAKAEGNTKQIMAAEVTLNLAKQELANREKIRDAIVKDMQLMQNILDVANLAANIAGGISDAFNAIKDMAEALGADTDSGAWADISAVMETLTTVTSGISKIVQSTMNGDIGGILGGAFSTIATPVTIWSKLHDQKLQKQIEGNKLIYDLLETQLSLITERLTYSLGGSKDIKDPDAERDKARYEQALAKSKDKRADTLSRRFNEHVAERYKPRVEAYEEGGVYAYQRQLMMEQKASLEAQRKAEASKKNSDSAALAEYDKQIASLRQKIKDFAEETAKNLYGIDIKGWASQIGDALVEAFAKGEDAAEAFNSTVADIMKSVVSKVISVGIIEKEMKKLQTFLFGDGSDGYAAGEGGAFGHDFTLQTNEIAELGAILKGLENTVGLSKGLYDTIDNLTGGMLTEAFSGKNGLSAGIQGVTEDTADLLASYINGMRGDLSLQVHEYWPKLLNEAFPGMRVVAEAQLDIQRQIAGNTHQTALAAEKIAKSNDDISRLLVRVTQGGDKFYIH